MKILSLFAITLLCAMMGLAANAHEEFEIALSEVPEAVLQTASAARQGIKLRQAERIVNQGKVSYELEGSWNGEEIEILIAEDGTLIELEMGDD